MSVREYVGSRYVPVFADPLEWNSANTYEPLTIVLYQGNSYTSRQAVPAGIAITNTAYWAQTGNYNAQIEQYRQEVQALDTEIDNLLPVSIPNGGTGATDAAGARAAIDAAQSNGATNTLYDAELAIAENAADIADLQDSVNYVFDQTPGNRAMLRIGCRPRCAVPGGKSIEWVPFPFVTKNADYTLSIPSVTINNVGTFTPTVGTKLDIGMTLVYPTIDCTNGPSNGNGYLMTLTFA